MADPKIRTKRCSRCERVRAAELFARSGSSRDGLQAYCKPCQLAYGREYRARPKKVPEVYQIPTCPQCGEIRPQNRKTCGEVACVKAAQRKSGKAVAEFNRQTRWKAQRAKRGES